MCRALLDRLPEDEQAEAIAAGEELAGALWNFLSGVEARATSTEAQRQPLTVAEPRSAGAGRAAGQAHRRRPGRIDVRARC